MKTILLLLVIGLLTINRNPTQIDQRAGSWKTWVIPSGEAYRLPPPPNATATLSEEKELLTAQRQRDSAAIQRINYWNAGAPGYRWQTAIEKLNNGFPPAWIRGKALMNIAIYDATVAAWQTKYTYHRPRPSTRNKALIPYLTNLDSPSYPCEHAVAAGAASAILGYLFPAKADSIRQVAEQACRSRVLAGVVYPSDSKAGFELGQRVAQAVIALAKTDGADAVWDGKRPTGTGLWNDKRPPIDPMMGACKPWVLAAGNQFRPGPPPEPVADMKELKQFKKTPRSIYRAVYWANNDFWGGEIDRKLFEHNLHLDAPQAARAYALVSIAANDGYIACWDAKYTYWSIRPDQYDTTYVPPLMGTPPHPSYPSGHATISSARATVLGYLFPEDAQYFLDKAKEAAESRFEGGVHFRIDNVVGLDMGHKVGEEVIKRARQDGADGSSQIVRK
ncbi:phosphatase PAP2 family protein [Spirosoma pollinicola]|uniref:PA-phosphatase n=1 Tax=Spirosoma pollinicola TaxID=2057025 RepID=A0A2K8Z1G0_9BACT|nr:phosphatase PAP2 family protein [Spirosoma pollinicola]AUD03707.1 PA-phosphatase [Spirosoma pollinicola]